MIVHCLREIDRLEFIAKRVAVKLSHHIERLVGLRGAQGRGEILEPGLAQRRQLAQIGAPARNRREQHERVDRTLPRCQCRKGRTQTQAA